MDEECAYCGRAEAATREVFCDDCHTQHQVCAQCADEARSDAA